MRYFMMVMAFVVCGPALAQDSVPRSQVQIDLSFAPLVKKVSPAVVNIYTKRVVTARANPFSGDPFFEQFFGRNFGGGVMRQRIENSLGSGVIVEGDGLVVTNAHVVADAEEITVVLPDGREFAARKALVDAPSDLALLRIDSAGEDLPHVPLAPSENLEVGDLVLAIGNPFGVGQTVTSGIVSALARSTLNISDFNFFIQTDAAINPGNSGGPLVAMDGGIVGINSAIYSRSGGSLGIGFAIPSEMVATVIAAEKAGQAGDKGIARAWLGISAQRVTQDIADSLGLRGPGGVLVSNLHKASPALKAGLKTGDVVTSVNGKAVRDPSEMKFRMATIPIGGTATFEFLRKGDRKTIEVAAIPPPEVPARNETTLSGLSPLSGATLANINPAVATELGLKEDEGVVITATDGRGQAARFARPGDVVVSINDIAVKEVGDLKGALATGAQRGGWVMTLSRGGVKQQIIVR